MRVLSLSCQVVEEVRLTVEVWLEVRVERVSTFLHIQQLALAGVQGLVDLLSVEVADLLSLPVNCLLQSFDGRWIKESWLEIQVSFAVFVRTVDKCVNCSRALACWFVFAPLQPRILLRFLLSVGLIDEKLVIMTANLHLSEL